MTKMRLTTLSTGAVSLEYDDEDTQERVTRTFCCPSSGGYVRELHRDEWKQVCNLLAARGETLTCPSDSELPDLIRTEYKAMRRTVASLDSKLHSKSRP